MEVEKKQRAKTQQLSFFLGFRNAVFHSLSQNYVVSPGSINTNRVHFWISFWIEFRPGDTRGAKKHHKLTASSVILWIQKAPLSDICSSKIPNCHMHSDQILWFFYSGREKLMCFYSILLRTGSNKMLLHSILLFPSDF